MGIVQQARQVAQRLLGSDGKLQLKTDGLTGHMLAVVEQLRDDPELQRLLQRVARPDNHLRAQQIIRSTLGLPPRAPLEDLHARQAALVAWLTPLRQSVGSCFATAPAIMIQREQPRQFLSDLIELLGRGRLSRTAGGVEYTAPLSISWGVGELRRPVLWEGDLAQLVELTGLEPEQVAAAIKELSIEPPATVWAEILIRTALLVETRLTWEEAELYRQHRPLLARPMQAPAATDRGHQFWEKYEAARSAFRQRHDCALLRTWEYTIASFAEAKPEFVRWNFCRSLGLNTDEPEGIGNALAREIEQRITAGRSEVEELQERIERLVPEVQHLESRLQRASTAEIEYLRGSYRHRVLEMEGMVARRDAAYARVMQLIHMFERIREQYVALFPDYFQEVYDADMQEATTSPWDDTPAGFRLVYTHGRTNTAQWSPIESAEQYGEALAAFLIATEPQLVSEPLLAQQKDEVERLISKLVLHVRTREFLDAAMKRVGPNRTPWSFVAGASMDHLVSILYKREHPPTTSGRWVDSPTDLSVMLLDALKEIPPGYTNSYINAPHHAMLAHSPTHAFLLQPGRRPWLEGWQDSGFTYSYIRDHWIAPRRRMLEQMELTRPMVQRLLDEWMKLVPAAYRSTFMRVMEPIPSSTTAPELFRLVLERIRYHPWKPLQQVLNAERISGDLYAWLPLTPGHQLPDIIQSILGQEREISRAMRLEWLTAQQLHTTLGDAALDELEQRQLILPRPIIFADTNWIESDLGFIVSPATLEWELWRFDPQGRQGKPMYIWRHHMDGSDRTPWLIYTRPNEYNQMPT